MKITPPKNADHTANISRAVPRRSAAATGGSAKPASADDGHAPAGAAERDFASVLDELARADEISYREDESGSRERDSDFDVRRGEREAERRRDDERDDADKGGFDRGGNSGAGAARERARGEAAGARSILHIADLERIVAAVRAQMDGARGEVTLRLHRSVLEGLQIKLSLDEAGRVHAEFIAAGERMRLQLDERTSELAALMRARGVPLASLKTSVGADSSGGDFAARDDDAASRDPGRENIQAPDEVGHNAKAPQDAFAKDSEIPSGTIYRA